jgi:hypothetical protein
MRRGLTDVAGDDRVDVSGEINAVLAAPDTALDDLADLHNPVVAAYQEGQTPMVTAVAAPTTALFSRFA